MDSGGSNLWILAVKNRGKVCADQTFHSVLHELRDPAGDRGAGHLMVKSDKGIRATMLSIGDREEPGPHTWAGRLGHLADVGSALVPLQSIWHVTAVSARLQVAESYKYCQNL
jgi:hypothetical protein